MKIRIDKDDIIERKADSRGRVTLGKEYSNEEVQLVVLERKDALEDEVKQKLKELLEENPEIVEELSEGL